MTPIRTRPLSDLARIVLAVLMVLAYCAVQRGPLGYPDSFAYYKVGAEIGRILHLEPKKPAGVAQAGDTSATVAVAHAAKPAEDPRLPYTAAGARSPYYGFFLYLFAMIGTGWLAAAMQAGLVLAVLLIAFRTFADPRDYLPSMALLTVFSGMAAYLSFLMADFGAPLAVLGALILIWRWKATSRAERILLILLIAFSAAVHTSHLLTGLLLGGGTLAIALVKRDERISRRGTAAFLGALILGAVAATVYPIAAQKLTGQKLYSPPFLSARVFADGTGRAYLAKICPADENAFILCPYRRQTVPSANAFLWPDDGIFQRADYDTRVRMSREDKRLFFGAVLNDPVGTVRASLKNIGTIILAVSPANTILAQATLDPTDLAGGRGLAMGRPVEGCPGDGARCLPRIGPRVALILCWIGVAAAIGAIGWAFGRNRVDRRAWTPPLLYVLAALLLNAAICASLSSPASRYQARLFWLVPAVALMIVSDARRRRYGVAEGAGSAR